MTHSAEIDAGRLARAKHGPHCRTHMAGLMPNYGSDCTCGGDWTPERQLEALIYRIVSPTLPHDIAERVARDVSESGLVVGAPGTLAAVGTSVTPPAGGTS